MNDLQKKQVEELEIVKVRHEKQIQNLKQILKLRKKNKFSNKNIEK